MDEILPLPVPAHRKIVKRCKPPNLVYTSPESLDFIRSKDKEAEVDFDVEVVSDKRGRGAVQSHGRGVMRGSSAVRGSGAGRGVMRGSSAVRDSEAGRGVMKESCAVRGSGAGRGQQGG